MEKDFFIAENWDEFDTGVIAFSGLTFVRDLGPFKEGGNYPEASATINFVLGELRLYNKEGTEVYSSGLKVALV